MFVPYYICYFIILSPLSIFLSRDIHSIQPLNELLIPSSKCQNISGDIHYSEGDISAMMPRDVRDAEIILDR